MIENFDKVVLAALKDRITQILPAQIRTCLEELDDEQIWWRPNETSNSIGNLVLHISGSLNHYLAFQIGGVNFLRNRSAEFLERNKIPKDELIKILNQMVEQVTKTFESFEISRLMDSTSEQNYNPTIFHAFFNAAVHLSVHAGQIIFITKMLKEGAVDELWVKAHQK